MISAASALPLEEFTKEKLEALLAKRRSRHPHRPPSSARLEETGVYPNMPQDEDVRFPLDPRLKQKTAVSSDLIIEGILPSMAIFTSRRNTVCEFYLRGRCKRPDCSYYHPPPEEMRYYRELYLGRR